MPTELEASIAELLRDAEAAHGDYEVNTLGAERDEDWAGWYASHLLDHGFIELLPGLANADRESLAATLAHLDQAFRREQAPGEWPEFYARSLLSGS